LSLALVHCGKSADDPRVGDASETGGKGSGGSQNTASGGQGDLGSGGDASGGTIQAGGAAAGTGAAATGTGAAATGTGGEGGGSDEFVKIDGQTMTELRTCDVEGSDIIYVYAATESSCTFFSIGPSDSVPCVGLSESNGYCVVYGEHSSVPEFCAHADTVVGPNDLIVLLRSWSGEISVEGDVVTMDLEFVWSGLPPDQDPFPSFGPETVALRGRQGSCADRTE
jgi:hypothetical protein